MVAPLFHSALAGGQTRPSSLRTRLVCTVYAPAYQTRFSVSSLEKK